MILRSAAAQNANKHFRLQRHQIKNVENNEEAQWQHSVRRARRASGSGCGTELRGSFQAFNLQALIFCFFCIKKSTKEIQRTPLKNKITVSYKRKVERAERSL